MCGGEGVSCSRVAVELCRTQQVQGRTERGRKIDFACFFLLFTETTTTLPRHTCREQILAVIDRLTVHFLS